MSSQLKLEFSKNTIQNINQYFQASKQESLDSSTSYTVKFTPTQKEALKNILKEHNMKASTFLREAMDFYIGVFPYRNKIRRHRSVLSELIARLP